eukprot:scaffold65616_cov29-Attheya_sp.AAC.1
MMEGTGYRQDERGRSTSAALVTEGTTPQRYPMSILVGAPGRSHDTAEAQVLSRRREAHAQLRLARQLRASLEAAVRRNDADTGNANGGGDADTGNAKARQVMGSVLPEIRRLALLTET